MLQDIEIEFLNFIDEIHLRHGQETNFWTLSNHLNVVVRIEKRNSAGILAGQPLITLNPLEYGGRQSFSKMHELAHILLKVSRIERRLIDLHGSVDAAMPHIERLCNLGASRLLMPSHYVEEVLWPAGPTALAVQHLARRAHVSLQAALRRVVHFEESASLAGFITSRGTVRDTTLHNCRLPFDRSDILPRSHPIFQARENKNLLLQIDDVDLHVLQVPFSQTRLGLVVATYP